MSELSTEIGLHRLDPPEKCCHNCAFNDKISTHNKLKCIILREISNICNTSQFYSFPIQSTEDSTMVCDLFCSKQAALAISKA